jgi:hypothetical protein
MRSNEYTPPRSNVIRGAVSFGEASVPFVNHIAPTAFECKFPFNPEPFTVFTANRPSAVYCVLAVAVTPEICPTGLFNWPLPAYKNAPPLDHPAVEYPGSRHAVPKSVPVALYVHVSDSVTSVWLVAGAPGGAKFRSPIVPPSCGLATQLSAGPEAESGFAFASDAPEPSAPSGQLPSSR